MSERSAPSGATDQPDFTVEYRVTHRFKYAGRYLNPGETFRPDGGKYDEQIITQGKVVERIESALPSTRASRSRVRKETS